QETTELIKQSRILDINVFTGRQMLVAQVRKQFSLMTGVHMPLALANQMAGVIPIEIPISAEEYQPTKLLQRVG
ncbi:MAG: hypothetical protein JKY54_11745, partial [Flavobacteriales bacterium]|nr:hypothetical protein [Flavobacteriales bacterium]